ncbi:hypothetical protein E4198_15030 [Streptomyces sp. RKND-216]|nr:hypothetical protein E4198_15030 [Streptomyces sp. RKND-216]
MLRGGVARRPRAPSRLLGRLSTDLP